VQRQVGDMIPGRIHFPQPPLQPKRAVCHRPIIVGFSGKPELVRAVRGLNLLVCRQKFVVVQDKSAAEGGVVGDADGRRDQPQFRPLRPAAPPMGRKVATKSGERVYRMISCGSASFIAFSCTSPLSTAF